MHYDWQPSEPQEPVSAKKNCITAALVSALDRCKVSDRFAVRLLIEAARAFGLNPEEFVISRSSIRRCRKNNRNKMASVLKNKPEVI